MRRLVAACALVVAACDHPIAAVTPHVEVADLVLRDQSGAELARTVVNRGWSVDSLVLREGMPLPLAIDALDFRGAPVRITGRADLDYRVSVTDPALLAWEPLGGRGILRPFARGATRARFLIWHIDHADFVSPWLRVVIVPAAATAAPLEDPR